MKLFRPKKSNDFFNPMNTIEFSICKMGSASVASWIILSIFSSTSLILLLKFVKRNLTCKYTITLSTFHFIATWGLLEVFARFKMITRRNNVPIAKRLLLAFLVMTSIVTMNFNLEYNSIGFYQMSKLCCIPYMIIRNLVMGKAKYTLKELFSLALLLCGVALFSVSDVEVNVIGSIFAIIAVVSTAHNQMMTGELQKEYKINGPELQLTIIPFEFVFGLISSIIFENTGENTFIKTKFNFKIIMNIVGTCTFAVFVNIATFGLIGKTSSVTYQVVGHVKTILLLVFGYIFFPSQWESRQQMIKAILGIIIALIGVFLYTKIKIDLGKAPKREDTAPLIQENQEEDINEK